MKVDVSYDVDARAAIVRGSHGPFTSRKAHLHLGNAGTAMRPLVAALAAGTGDYVLDGTDRMRERPIQDLVQGLQQVSYESSTLGPSSVLSSCCGFLSTVGG